KPLRPDEAITRGDRERIPSWPDSGFPGFDRPGSFSIPGSRPDGLPKHRGEVVAVAFSPDGRLVAGGIGHPNYRGRAPFLTAWGQVPRGSPLGPGVDGFGARRDLIFLRANLLRLPPPPLWDATTGKPLKPTAHGGPVWAVAFSPNGRALVTGGGRFKKDRLDS